MRCICVIPNSVAGPIAALLLWVFAGLALAQDRPSTPFDREILIQHAEALAKERFTPRTVRSDFLRSLTYDQYRSIRFKAGASIWQREQRGFTVDLFYPGYLFQTPVDINLVVQGRARPVLFTNDIFDFGPEPGNPDTAEASGYSGFRVRAPINREDYLDEFLVYQGASYFRAVARGQTYGLSARGLAVSTARPEGEEFPYFREFWIERPPLQSERIIIHALLDSPSVVGAYSFTVQAGTETVMDVALTLFPRLELANFGLAPLTSMFLFDASNRSRFDDFRTAVHDSDGLQILTGRGERVWRPLANPSRLQVSAFVDADPRGFGLLQRKRRFEDYQDFEAHYETRPSLWVEPIGSWGAGHVELVEIPTEREIHDNIVAYWQPAVPLPAGQGSSFAYRLRWLAEPLDDGLARVIATRTGRAQQDENQRVFAIDFLAGDDIPTDLHVALTNSDGVVSAPRGEAIRENGIYRVSFDLDPERADVIELRLALSSQGKAWSETWLYRWSL